MIKTEIFDKQAAEYDAWFDQHKAVFVSETEALRNMLPPGNSYGIEVGLGTGRFAVALGIKEGVETAEGMREVALSRGIEVMDAAAEHLPYKDLHFDFVLMVTCINHLDHPVDAFREAHRVLKHGGRLIVGTIEKNSIIGQSYEARRRQSLYYHQATFYSTEKLVERLQDAQFGHFEFSQTLFHPLDEIESVEISKPGYGEGAFVVIKAMKK